jgi:hypothetical protein
MINFYENLSELIRHNCLLYLSTDTEESNKKDSLNKIKVLLVELE